MSEDVCPERALREQGGQLAGTSALVAAVVATVLPFLGGLATGWTAPRVALYLTLAVVYLIFIWLYRADHRLGRWLWRHSVLGFGAVGLVCTALVVVSGDPVIQPIAYTVPFVFAFFALGLPRAAWLGAAYMTLLAIGIWLSGERELAGLIYPVGVYSALLIFMAGFVQMAQEQSAAREQADALAADLATERDALAALAAENARLAAEAGLAATLAERNRIARELHDTIAQGLTAVTMQLEAAQRAFERDPERSRVRLGRAHELARETLVEVRRSVWTLATPVVDGPALGQALSELACRFAERTGLNATYAHAGAPLRLDSERAAQTLRIAQEALQNVEKHAAARLVELGTSHGPDGTLELWVRDDGRGFDPALPPSSPTGGGFGLHSLHERARLAGGTLTVASALGRGTTVRLTIPGG